VAGDDDDKCGDGVPFEPATATTAGGDDGDDDDGPTSSTFANVDESLNAPSTIRNGGERSSSHEPPMCYLAFNELDS